GPVAGTQVRQIAPAAEKGRDVTPLPGGFNDRVDVPADAGVAAEVVFDVALGVLLAYARAPGKAEAADAVDDAKVNGLGRAAHLRADLLGRHAEHFRGRAG